MLKQASTSSANKTPSKAPLQKQEPSNIRHKNAEKLKRHNFLMFDNPLVKKRKFFVILVYSATPTEK